MPKTVVGENWHPTNSQIQAMHDQNIRFATRLFKAHVIIRTLINNVDLAVDHLHETVGLSYSELRDDIDAAKLWLENEEE